MDRRALAPAVVAVAAFSAFALTACGSPEDGTRDASTPTGPLMDDLRTAMQQDGRDVYGGLAGSGDEPQRSSIQITGERDGLAVYALCSADAEEGEATVRIADEPPATLSCADGGELQVLDADVALTGARLTVGVESAPAGSTWAIAAGPADRG
ncbi:hypothetical protein FGG90_11615 [Clavibacter tessellarius]|uniref:Lipoprotein n=1 Tax=Clavibacter tessellarius TaxID=31965 RepID=A0A225CJ54_9MICO|nr:hypothetical protein [Clavibacter michiganensis]OQJ62426.1 hypothetical protein B5P24_05105 [Clavibacter michiganensis subsp. tessellarius]UKF34580.1 hypothetical protein FGG90_11615 [Clavibacter michiganensis subsp. tessellarius]